MMAAPVVSPLVNELRSLLESAGGVATLPQLADRWGISKQRVHELSGHPSFPAPLMRVGKMGVYLVQEADEFRNTKRLPGRPPKHKD